MTHWETEKESEPDPSVPVWKRPYHRAGASNIEMTAYGLLVYTAEHKVFSGLPTLKWLASQRNPNGGFSSTQVRGHYYRPFPGRYLRIPAVAFDVILILKHR